MIVQINLIRYNIVVDKNKVIRLVGLITRKEQIKRSWLQVRRNSLLLVSEHKLVVLIICLKKEVWEGGLQMIGT
jgi:hypothetical protein